eukprot:g38918.t1
MVQHSEKWRLFRRLRLRIWLAKNKAKKTQYRYGKNRAGMLTCPKHVCSSRNLPPPRSTSIDMPKRKKCRTSSSSSPPAASASSSSSSLSARSLDDNDDIPMQASASLSVKCLQETVEGLDAATREARQSLAPEIAQRKAGIAGLEQELAALGTQIQQSKGEGIDVLSKQLINLHVMIGKHKDTVAELEGRSEVKVKVKVKRVRTCVELLKTETSSEDQEVRMVPRRDAGIYRRALGTVGSFDNCSIRLCGLSLRLFELAGDVPFRISENGRLGVSNQIALTQRLKQTVTGSQTGHDGSAAASGMAFPWHEFESPAMFEPAISGGRPRHNLCSLQKSMNFNQSRLAYAGELGNPPTILEL